MKKRKIFRPELFTPVALMRAVLRLITAAAESAINVKAAKKLVACVDGS